MKELIKMALFYNCLSGMWTTVFVESMQFHYLDLYNLSIMILLFLLTVFLGLLTLLKDVSHPALFLFTLAVGVGLVYFFFKYLLMLPFSKVELVGRFIRECAELLKYGFR